MNLSTPFIERPVATALLTLAIALAFGTHRTSLRLCRARRTPIAESDLIAQGAS